MNNNMTEIVIVLDKSGSMGNAVNDTLIGLNRFIDQQKQQPGDARVSLVMFDYACRTMWEGVNINNVKPLTASDYQPCGGTALLDALGSTIDQTGSRLRAMPENERPGNVVVVVVTDGEENSSHFRTLEGVRDSIKHQTEKYSWTFVYLGADHDSFTQAQSMGFAPTNTADYGKGRTRQTFDNLGGKFAMLRSGNSCAAEAFTYTDADREEIKDA